MWDIKKIITGIDVKSNNSTSLYHTTQSFVNTKQGKDEPNDALKLRFENMYETMELSGGEKIIWIKTHQ